jgi:hypothetical protein
MSLLPQRRHYVAVFLVSLALLMLEISMARILTVALVSHYAFVAVSLAMFGLGLSGLVIYLLPSRFPASRVDEQLPLFASLFGVASALALLAFLHLQVLQEVSRYGYLSLSLAYTVLAVPYFLGGLCISLAMTHFSSRIASVYFADLVGASAGCLGVVAALQMVPAPQVVLVVAVTVTAAASVFSVGRRHAPLAHAGTVLAAGLLVAGFTTDLFTMRYVKTWDMRYAKTELWNAFSRVAAFELPGNAAQILPMKEPSAHYEGGPYPPSLMLDIDGAAWTPMMGWDGKLESIQFLRDSVLYLAHHMKPAAKTLVIGTGGGRDLLAGLAFGQPSILGLEINPLMRRMVEEEYGDYTSRPYSRPGVEVVIDEARSRLTSMTDTFDIIQLSLIDTFSLNASGGFVFSENYLYTTEGFDEYLDHLNPDGVLSLTRYFVPAYPLEILRLVSMSRDAWERRGIRDFASHVVVLRQNLNATMLVKKSPWTSAELEHVRELSGRLNAEMLYVPGVAGGHPDITALITTPDWRSYCAAHAFHIDPPTDDAPFFFNFLRREVEIAEDDPFYFLRAWNDALKLMYRLMGVVTVIASLFFLTPLAFFARQRTHRIRAVVAAPLLLYFACLGYGFLMIEIPLLQRFVLFLGYPVYALAVVLFALLLFSGIGSLTVGWSDAPPMPRLTRVLLGIVALSVAYVGGVPWAISWFLGSPILVRIAITVALLAPIGLLLGMAYPLGISVLREHGEELVPWAWGLNGVMSVVASVIAVFIGSRIGFTAAFLTGVAAYAVALVCMQAATRLSRT